MIDNLTVIIDGARHRIRADFNDHEVGWRLYERGCELPDSASAEMVEGYHAAQDAEEGLSIAWG